MKRSMPIVLFLFLIAFAWGGIAAGQETTAFPIAAPESQGMSSDALNALADVVRDHLDRDFVVGAELLVIKNRRTVLHESFGFRDRDDKIAWEDNTICNLRSMTKPLTGAAVQILIDRGKLKLQDKVAAHLPGFDNDLSGEITIEQLLTHRSGLPLTILTTADEYPDLRSMANAAGEAGPEHEPDSKFWYSDSGTDVLAAVVAEVSGQSIDEFVRQNILKPLGMSETFYFYQGLDDPRNARIASLYVGSAGSWMRYWKPGDESMYPCAWGSQTLYGTPRDYAKFLAMWMDGGKEILSPEAIRRILTPVSEMSALGSDMRSPTFFGGLETWYGQMSQLWLPVDAKAGDKPVVIGHSGSDGTIGWAWPELDLMILYFTQTRGSLSVLRLEEDVDGLLIHPDRQKVAAEDPERYQPYLGTYVANYGPFRNTEFTVKVHDGNLAVDVPGQLIFDLKEPDEEDKWYFVMTDKVAVSFDIEESGEVTGMHVHEAGMTFDLPKGKAEKKPEPPLDMELARKYSGVYRNEEEAVDITVLIQNEHLAIQVPGQPVAFELYPPDENGLWAMRLNASVKIRFDEDGEGAIVSFTAVLPDGTELVRPRIPDAEEEGESQEEADG